MKEKVLTIVFMIVIATVFTAAVAAVHHATRERVRFNQELAGKEAAMRALGMDVPRNASFAEVSDLFKKMEVIEVKTAAGTETVYADKARKLGYALDIGGRGFWENVRGYLGVSPDFKLIRGIAFYQQSETPGLGAEIAKPWFMRQFADKEIPAQVEPGAPIVTFVPPSQETLGPREVHAITGATGTSNAVSTFLNADLHRILTDIRPQLEKARKGGGN